MAEFKLLISPAAHRDLKKLPVDVQTKVVYEHLPAIERDPFGVGHPLYGALKGELSYHFGRKPEYRIICYVENELITVTINWQQREFIQTGTETIRQIIFGTPRSGLEP